MYFLNVAPDVSGILTPEAYIDEAGNNALAGSITPRPDSDAAVNQAIARSEILEHPDYTAYVQLQSLRESPQLHQSHSALLPREPTEDQGVASRPLTSDTQFFEIPHDTSILATSTADNLPSSRPDKFLGFCLDYGVARSFVDKKQYIELCKYTGTKLKVHASTTVFKFGQTIFYSAVVFLARIRVSQDSFLEFKIDIVRGYLPLLIGPEVMIGHELHLDFVKNQLSDSTNTCSLLIFYLRGHAFVKDAVKHNVRYGFFDKCMTSQVEDRKRHIMLYTFSELEKLHYYFYHPSSGKLFNLLKRFNPEHATP